MSGSLSEHPRRPNSGRSYARNGSRTSKEFFFATSSLAVLGCFVLFGMSSGCATQYFAETRLHSDGSVERSIWQPRSDAAKVEGQEHRWTQVVTVTELTGRQRPLDIRRRAESQRDEGGRCLAAWGTFASASDIPQHAVFPTPNNREFGHFRRHTSQRDFVFVKEHVWEETLADVVSLEWMRKGVDRLADSLVRDAGELLTARWGTEFDVAPLVEWFNATGRLWLRESVELLYDSMARRSPLQTGERSTEVFENIVEGWAEIASGHGLHLFHADGRVYGRGEEDESELARASWDEFLAELLREKLIPRSAKPLVEDRLDQLTAELTAILLGLSNNDPEAQPPIAQEDWDAWRLAMDRVIEQHHGNLEACRQHYQNLLGELFGVFLFPGGSSNVHFEYALEMPGTILETSGRLVAENRVTWKFLGSEAFPFGYVMSCRSLEPREDIQHALLGAAPLRGREALLTFVGILEDFPSIQDRLEQCKQQGSMAPLREYHRQWEARGRPLSSAQEAEQNVLVQLWMLLGREP